MVACKIMFVNQVISLVCVYIPPGISIDAFMPTICCLRELCSNKYSSIVIGNFNLPKIDWKNCLVPLDAKSQELFNLSCDLGFEQCNLEPTRNGNVLDPVFCDDPLLLSGLQCCEPFLHQRS